jgi:hypothetical protein
VRQLQTNRYLVNENTFQYFQQCSKDGEIEIPMLLGSYQRHYNTPSENRGLIIDSLSFMIRDSQSDAFPAIFFASIYSSLQMTPLI